MDAGARYVENLEEIAADAYRLSARQCGSCADLHALWPYIRLSRMSTGIEASQLEDQLHRLFAVGARDTLIAGCADTGLLALMARAATNHGPRIVALDICRTPLDLCQRLADRWGLPIGTMQKDLLELDNEAKFDVVLVHGTLHFIAADQRGKALVRMQRALRPTGRLVLMFNTSRKVRTEVAEHFRDDYAASVLSELARLGTTLPDTEQAMRERLYHHSRRREAREGAFSSPEQVTQLLDETGFIVERCLQVDVPIAGAAAGFMSETSKRRFMAVATPKPAGSGIR